MKQTVYMAWGFGNVSSLWESFYLFIFYFLGLLPRLVLHPEHVGLQSQEKMQTRVVVLHLDLLWSESVHKSHQCINMDFVLHIFFWEMFGEVFMRLCEERVWKISSNSDENQTMKGQSVTWVHVHALCWWVLLSYCCKIQHFPSKQHSPQYLLVSDTFSSFCSNISHYYVTLVSDATHHAITTG